MPFVLVDLSMDEPVGWRAAYRRQGLDALRVATLRRKHHLVDINGTTLCGRTISPDSALHRGVAWPWLRRTECCKTCDRLLRGEEESARANR